MALSSTLRRLVTHSGTFHADDALAYAVLRLALGLGEPGIGHRLLRTRDPAVIAAAALVWDVRQRPRRRSRSLLITTSVTHPAVPTASRTAPPGSSGRRTGSPPCGPCSARRVPRRPPPSPP